MVVPVQAVDARYENKTEELVQIQDMRSRQEQLESQLQAIYEKRDVGTVTTDTCEFLNTLKDIPPKRSINITEEKILLEKILHSVCYYFYQLFNTFNSTYLQVAVSTAYLLVFTFFIKVLFCFLHHSDVTVFIS